MKATLVLNGLKLKSFIPMAKIFDYHDWFHCFANHRDNIDAPNYYGSTFGKHCPGH